MSLTIKSRLSNSFLIGEIFGMLFFGVLIDRVGRRTGVIAATLFLVLGIALAAAAHGTSELGYVSCSCRLHSMSIPFAYMNLGCFG
jgi:MFS family permease